MKEDRQSVKVAELKPGMLLRFNEPMGVKPLRDHDDYYWLELNYGNSLIDPVILYIGQKEIPARTYFGDFQKVREVMINGRILWVMPSTWKFFKPAEISTND